MIRGVREVLKRSLVGAFEPRGETVTLAEIGDGLIDRGSKHSLNIYEMGNDFFLFEFALRVTVEQVIEGDWEWRNNPVILQWWNPTIGTRCGRGKENSTWVKIIGLPLHFWDQKIFKVIGDFCGGWVETEEETQLRNHLKWARIRINGDGAYIPKEVTIDGLICYNDANSRESPRSRGGKPPVKRKGEDPLQSQKVMHTVVEYIVRHGGKHHISRHKTESGKQDRGVELLYNKAKGIDHSKDFGESSGGQELVEGGMQIQQIHDAEPVSIQNPGYHTNGEIEASSWVKSHILELSKTYGVAFEGFREETHALLMKLDERKSVMEKKGATNSSCQHLATRNWQE
ncbi:hypothetical protein H5410_054983 [Solanum commersonii]|uniref:DUF4283 domain-containing protein n=1 Tax=Solanum commersonii TaxID=4109 RepID=A0A9J5WGD4_SOLCO|nr:hypothetical protein H5410_054983 [Solanum commersonii]